MGLYGHKKIGAVCQTSFNVSSISLILICTISMLFLSFRGSETTTDYSNSFWEKAEIVVNNLHLSTKGISNFTNQDILFSSSKTSSRGYFHLEDIYNEYKIMNEVFDGHEIILKPNRQDIPIIKSKKIINIKSEKNSLRSTSEGLILEAPSSRAGNQIFEISI